MLNKGLFNCSFFFFSLWQVWNKIHSFLFPLCRIRQLDWRPEKRAGPSRLRHERVVIIRNMFHPIDFEVGSSVLTDRNIDVLSFKGAQSLPHPIFLMSHPARSSSLQDRKMIPRINWRFQIFPGLTQRSFNRIAGKPV